MKILVVYYSFEGNTMIIAETIAEKLHADIERLIPEKDLDNKGFSKYLWGGSQVFMKFKPKLQTLVKEPKDYDLVFVGTPVWAWTYTPAIRALFEEGHIRNQKVYFFAIHEGQPKRALAQSKMLVERYGNTLLDIREFFDVKNNTKARIDEAKAWVEGIQK